LESSAGTLSIATKIFAKNFFYFTNGFYILLTHITILSSTLFEKLVGGGESTGYILAAGYISSYFVSFIFFSHSSSRFLVGKFLGSTQAELLDVPDIEDMDFCELAGKNVGWILAV